jgi:beta-catenin-like protein 1
MENSDELNSEEGNQEMTEEEINRLLQEAEEQGEEMNEETLTNNLKALDKKIQTNKTLRLKYANDPPKFIDSETDLHEEIKVLQRIAAYPNLIHIFVKNKGIEMLMGLLTHDNIDIVSDAILVNINK